MSLILYVEAMKQSARTNSQDKHEAILQSAVKLFLNNGYANTSMDAIAQLAGVTKQTVYGHFQNKESLFTSMVQHLCQTYTPRALSLSKHKKPETMLQEFGINFLTLITSREGLSVTRLVIAEAERYPLLAQLYYERGTLQLTRSLADALEQFNRKGVTHIDNTMSAASYFFALLKSRYHLRMMLSIKPEPKPKDKIAHVEEAVTVFMRIYGGPDPLPTQSVY